MGKEPKGVFAQQQKEPVIDRVFQLVERYPSRSAAARAWGINVNTLKNYYRRKDIQPTPRHNQLSKIAEVEGVSMEWLTTGEGDTPIKNQKNQSGYLERQGKGSLDKLSEMMSYLSEEERGGLIEILARKGIETVLYLLDEDNIELLRLDKVVKEKILGKQPQTPQEADLNAQKARECDSADEQASGNQSLVSERKQAS